MIWCDYGKRPLALIFGLGIGTAAGIRGEDGDQAPLVVLTSAAKRLAFGVDEVLYEQEVLEKPLGAQLSLDTVPDNLDLMGGCKLAEMAANLAGGADPPQFFPAL